MLCAPHLMTVVLSRRTLYSRSYAEDVTSVTSGASQGPHSFNLVFVCLCVCVTPGATVSVPYLSHTCDLVFVCLCVCFVSRLELPYLSRICDLVFVCLCHVSSYRICPVFVTAKVLQDCT